MCAPGNLPGLVNQVSGALQGAGVVIEGLANVSRGDVAYLVTDLASAPAPAIVAELAASDGIRMVRLL